MVFEKIDAKVCYMFFCPFDSGQEERARNEMFVKTDRLLGTGHTDAEDPVLKNISIAQNFLHGGGLPFACKHYSFTEYKLEMPGFEITESHLLLTVYPEDSVCQICVNIGVRSVSPDQLVYLRQIQMGNACFDVNGQYKSCVKDLVREILGKIDVPETVLENSAAETGYMVEINRAGEYDDAELLLLENKQPLYGIITGDEGWRFLPESLTDERMNSSWGSRKFMRAVILHNNFLLINLNSGAVGLDYVEFQKDYGGEFYGGANPYFLMDAPTAGVNHGIWFSASTCLVVKTISGQVIAGQSLNIKPHSLLVKKDIRQTKNYRRQLIITLNKLEMVGIAEIGELDRLIRDNLDIIPLIDNIKYLLELLESELDLLYQTSTNALVTLLTVLGLGLAVIQIFIEL